jgi:phage-related protein
MFEIVFYTTDSGKQPVKDYLAELETKTDKSSTIKFNKISAYIYVLKQLGTYAGLPYVKSIDGKIWELRPLKDRIFFFHYYNGVYVLLHHFIKKTQKTPSNEIDKARQNMKKFIEKEESK